MNPEEQQFWVDQVYSVRHSVNQMHNTLSDEATRIIWHMWSIGIFVSVVVWFS